MSLGVDLENRGEEARVPEAASYWDAQFHRGRWSDADPIGFTAEVIAAAQAAGISDGLYVGCGNGRNYVPMVAAGLDLIGWTPRRLLSNS